MQAAIDLQDSATAWFALLERARQTGDYRLAFRAANELRRLGVEVTFGKPSPATDSREVAR